jgi:hypothetical protein
MGGSWHVPHQESYQVETDLPDQGERRGRIATANPALVLAMAHVENIVRGLGVRA